MMNVKKSRRRSLRILKWTCPSEDSADCSLYDGTSEMLGSAWLADSAPHGSQQDCAPLNVHLEPGNGDCAHQNFHLQADTDSPRPENHEYSPEVVCHQPETDKTMAGNATSGPDTYEQSPLTVIHHLETTCEGSPQKCCAEFEAHEYASQNVDLQVMETHVRTPVNVHLQAETVDSASPCDGCLGDDASFEDAAVPDRLTGDRLTGDRLTGDKHTAGDGLTGDRHTAGDGLTGDRHTAGDGLTGDRHTAGDRLTGDRHTAGDGLTGDRHTAGDRLKGDWHTAGDGLTGDRHTAGDGLTGDRHSVGQLWHCGTQCSTRPASTEEMMEKDRRIADRLTEVLNEGFLCGDLSPGFHMSGPGLGDNPSFQKTSSSGCERSGKDESMTADSCCVVVPEASNGRDGCLLSKGEFNAYASPAGLNSELSNSPIGLARSENSAEISDSETPVSEKSVGAAGVAESAAESKRDAAIDTCHALTPEGPHAGIIPAPSQTGSTASVAEEQERLVPGLEEHDSFLSALKSEEFSVSKRLVPQTEERDASLSALRSEVSLSKRLVQEMDERHASLHMLKAEMCSSQRLVPELDEHSASPHTLESFVSTVAGRDWEVKTWTENKLHPSVSECVGEMTASNSIQTVTASRNTDVPAEHHPNRLSEREETNLLFLPLFTEQQLGGVQSQGSKTERKRKKQRRRAEFGIKFRLESITEEEVASNVESACGDMTQCQPVNKDLAEAQEEEAGLSSSSVRTRTKKSQKRRSADVCITALDSQDATESTQAETCLEKKCSASKQRRSSLRLYHQQSHRNRESNRGDDTESDMGEKSESRRLPGTAGEKTNTQEVSQADGLAEVLTDDLNGEDGVISSDLKQLYCNKNYKKPAGKTWETIFEVPSKGKHVSKMKRKRYLLFEDTIPVSKLKLRSKKAAKNGWCLGKLVLTKTDQDVAERLKQLDRELLDSH